VKENAPGFRPRALLAEGRDPTSDVLRAVRRRGVARVWPAAAAGLALRLALRVRLALRMRRVLYTRHFSCGHDPPPFRGEGRRAAGVAVRLALRVRRVLYTRHFLRTSAGGIPGWAAVLDPRFLVAAWRRRLRHPALRAVLDPRFSMGAASGRRHPLPVVARSAWDTVIHGRQCVRSAGGALMPLLDRRQSDVPSLRARQSAPVAVATMPPVPP
jgi:hypothetical protein